MRKPHQNPTPAQIRRRAYELWQQEGFPSGKDEEFYLQAEKDLSGEEKADPISERVAWTE
ncbi:hypothetical protein GGQ85_000871 [Nitrobacter vulgaris]|jgi:hypothetical protein|uniref:DUF2934 domain-containing protein n=1 Tax=Nitrobacter vulgaris TaxID=29421 RepID=A0A1V4I358_NITVU|nr:DUF2934 domain-containing protein [Nitrobacter vulgaris]MDR6303190.1 hypothetical protein [Nitrobacter vulgaris]OPH84564.1 hypothetical protein B2M20_00965 [Nitrobacter vulgaris]